MTAADLIAGLTQAIYVLGFFGVLLRAIRRPTPAHFDMSLFFGAITIVVVAIRVQPVAGPLAQWVDEIMSAFGMALPYLLLRLVDDYTRVQPLVKRGAELGLVLSVAAIVFVGNLPAAVTLGLVAYFLLVALYCSAAFIRAARRSQGVTRRRMQAISLGAVFLGTVVVFAGISTVTSGAADAVITAASELLGLASGIAFYVGFAPPRTLRRAWQEPELRAFLARAARLPRLPTTLHIVRELEGGASSTMGAPARMGILQDETGRLRFWAPGTDEPFDVEPGHLLSGRCFELQRVIFSADPVRDDPEGAESYRSGGIGAVLTAPITANERRLGVLVLYAERPPIFAEADIELVQLLADQAAVVLESRALIDHAASVRAHEEATRLKEDFLSAAAHDLKTPLTTVVAQAEFLERRALRDPGAPADLVGTRRIVREAKRLAALVTDLLDASRLEQGGLVGEREPVDLVGVAREIGERVEGDTHRISVEAEGAVVGQYDRRRVEQLLENLIENARKYSPQDKPVTVHVWQRNGEALVDVRDEGIGIPPADLPRIFERFSRGSNVDDRRFHGLGLGLYICRGIAEEHGGRVWAESELGKGSTFHVALPLAVKAYGRRPN